MSIYNIPQNVYEYHSQNIAQKYVGVSNTFPQLEAMSAIEFGDITREGFGILGDFEPNFPPGDCLRAYIACNDAADEEFNKKMRAALSSGRTQQGKESAIKAAKSECDLARLACYRTLLNCKD